MLVMQQSIPFFRFGKSFTDLSNIVRIQECFYAYLALPLFQNVGHLVILSQPSLTLTKFLRKIY